MEKKTKGQIFKERNGYSKTRKNLMSKHNCKTNEEYRLVAKKTRAKEKEAAKRKRDAAKAGRKVKAATGKKK